MKRILLAAVLVVCSTPVHADVNMQEGKWEIATEMEGLPFSPPKIVKCITKEDLVPKSEGEDSCKMKEQKVTGNKVTWKMQCNDGRSGEGEITYSGNSYKGTMRMNIMDGGKTRTMSMKLAGQRIGECTAKDIQAEKEAEKKNREMIATVNETHKQQEDALKIQEDEIKRAREIFDSIAMPKEGPDACLVKDVSCEKKFGRLNILGGLWRVSKENAVKTTNALIPVKGEFVMGDRYSTNPVESDLVLDMYVEIPERIAGSVCVKTAKRSGNTMTWECDDGERGGIIFKGNTFEGSAIKDDSKYGIQHVTKTRIKGRYISDRFDDGVRELRWINWNERARAYTSQERDYTSQKRDASKGGITVPDNPVKSIRKLFGR